MRKTVIASIVGQQGDTVLVSVPMVGFPEGFQLRPGERVVLEEADDEQLRARPLVRAILEAPDSDAASRPGVVSVSGSEHIIQRSTALSKRDTGEATTFVVDRGHSNWPTHNVIAVRHD